MVTNSIKRDRPIVARSIYELPVEELVARGVRALAFDIENTIAPRGARLLDAKPLEFLLGLRYRGMERIGLGTNSRSDYGGMVKQLNRPDFPCVLLQPGKRREPHKPQHEFFTQLCRRMQPGHDKWYKGPNELGMVGDKLLFDVLPAIRYGMWGVLVNPIGSDIWFEKLAFRRFRERRALQRLDLARPS